MLHAKFQVSSRPGTCFSKIQIWPKSAVNRVLNIYRRGKCFFSLLGFEFGVMWGCFVNVFGLPYRLASLLIIPKTKKFGCVGRRDLTLLFFSKVVK